MVNEPDTSVAGPSKLPVCFALPAYGPPPPSAGSDAGSSTHRLHGADDLISLFDLRSLWERSVKPFTGSTRAAPQQGRSDVQRRRDDDKAAEADQADAADEKPRPMERTYVNYVRDLPGKVRPAKRAISKLSAAYAAASASGEAPPPIPEELAGRTTMRDIVFRPETTVQRVGPFDEDSLRAAFTVEAGDVPDIDLSLLESEDMEPKTPSKKKKKRKHQADLSDRSGISGEAAAKRSKLNAIAGGGRSSQQRP